MELSNSGIKFIAGFEGLKLWPYEDSAGYASIGIGHLIRKGPINPALDRQISIDEAYTLFRQDSGNAVHAVNTFVTVPLTQSEFDAIVSFTYNLGAGTLKNSVVLREINYRNFEIAMDHLKLYNKAGGVPVAGLTRRREAEANLFLSGKYF